MTIEQKYINLFNRKVARSLDPDSCWDWWGEKTKYGYGRFKVNKITTYAHRFSYELHVGPIEYGLQIDHLCRNTSCANPRHLEAVTPKENTERATNHYSNKTHCPKGHEYTALNTYIRVNKRHCRRCHTLREQIRRQRS